LPTPATVKMLGVLRLRQDDILWIRTFPITQSLGASIPPGPLDIFYVAHGDDNGLPVDN
jgi:hypothetical protein